MRYRLRGETLDDLLERLKTLNYRAAIVGLKGSGKTTLLEDLGGALSALGFRIKYLRLDASRGRGHSLGRRSWERRPWQRRPSFLSSSLKRLFIHRSFPRGFLKEFFAQLTERDVILFDGAEQMSRLEWQFFKARSKEAAGLVVTSHDRGVLPSLKECTTDPELLDDIIAELLEAESAKIVDASIELHGRHNGNLRDALREMYDLYAAADRQPGFRIATNTVSQDVNSGTDLSLKRFEGPEAE